MRKLKTMILALFTAWGVYAADITPITEAMKSGTHKLLGENGVECEFVYKISEGRPNIEDKLKNGEISLVINTSDSKSSSTDAAKIRQSVLRFRLPYFTTMKAAIAATRSICSIKDESALEVKTLQEYLSGK